jgi:hypothetical protein
MSQRMKELQAKAEATLTCYACITRKTNGHTYSHGCHFNTGEPELYVFPEDETETEEQDDRTTVTVRSDVED